MNAPFHKILDIFDAVNKNSGQKNAIFFYGQKTTIYLAYNNSKLGIFYLVNNFVNKMLTKMLIILSRYYAVLFFNIYIVMLPYKNRHTYTLLYFAP